MNKLESIAIEIVPLKLMMLLIMVETTTESKETSQIYMKYYRHGNKVDYWVPIRK